MIGKVHCHITVIIFMPNCHVENCKTAFTYSTNCIERNTSFYHELLDCYLTSISQVDIGRNIKLGQ